MIETLLSTPKEVHSFAIGLAYGLSPRKGLTDLSHMRNKDVKDEYHYACGGFTAGKILQVGFLLLLGRQL